MPNPYAVEQLDEGIEALLSGAERAGTPSNLDLRELLALAEELQALPDPDFKARLKLDLLEQAAQDVDAGYGSCTHSSVYASSKSSSQVNARDWEILPTLSGSGYGDYPVQRGSFLASAFAHTVALTLLVTAGIFAARAPREVPRVSSVVLTDIGPYLLPPASDPTRGGGGGGDRDDLQASQGMPPRFSRDQVVPPAIVVRNETPVLTADSTVVGPPSLSFPQTGQLGDPLSRILSPTSNGTGTEGGIGSGSRGGVGPGRGPGVGPGSGGGIGGGPYVVGFGVSAPRPIYEPEPEYSDEARKAKYQGSVVLRVVVGSDGRPQDIHVARSLGMGLDERAVEAVRQWRFEPARKGGQPVSVLVDIQVDFRLY